VRNDVARKLMSSEVAREQYGVVLNGNSRELDVRATQDLRESLKRTRPALLPYDFGERRVARNSVN